MQIGSEFQLEFEECSIKDNNLQTYLKEYETLYVDSGRSAINLISHMIGEGEILVPAYACVSVMYSFKRNIQPVYYKVDTSFQPDLEDLENKITKRTKAIFLMHYWGKLLPTEILEKFQILKEKYALLIIEDTTQSIFSARETIGDYMLCSLRKWFAIPDGGVIYSKKTLAPIEAGDIKEAGIDRKAYIMALKTQYLRQELDSREYCDSQFAAIEEQLNERGYKQENCYMSDLTYFLLSCQDILQLIQKRQENAKTLQHELISIPEVRPVYDAYGASDCPFMLSFYVERRDELRKELFTKDICTCVLWFVYKTELIYFETSAQMAGDIIQLPIDQRYTKKQMKLIAEAIRSFYAGIKGKEGIL
ncbi:MAG: DegT/DnrJ/EryC1/StrS family aminotransferase [Lachnospiraceae bacterium]